MLPSFIQEDQTGYTIGRLIGQNIRLIGETIECTKTVYNSGKALFLDFKKAGSRRYLNTRMTRSSCLVRDEKSVEKLFEKLEAFKGCCRLELNR